MRLRNLFRRRYRYTGPPRYCVTVESEAGAPDGTVVCSFSAPDENVRLERITAGFQFTDEDQEPIVPPLGRVAGFRIARIGETRIIGPVRSFGFYAKGPESRAEAGMRWRRKPEAVGDPLLAQCFDWCCGIDIPVEMLDSVVLDRLAILTLGEYPPNASLILNVQWVEHPVEAA